MHRDLNRLANENYDVLVIGGGIYGAFVAWDAVLRGLLVALVEKEDFGGATSANSLKIIHGGLRYLQDGNLRLVRAMARERRAWMQIAPHLVHPLPCVLPTYGQLSRSKPLLEAALAANDWLSRTAAQQPDEQAPLPRSRTISRRECEQWLDGLAGEGVTGGALWFDGQIYHAERLTLSVILSAAEAGAAVANYVEATGFLQQGGRIGGIHARDRLSGSEFSICARVVVNATGPWVDHVLRQSIDRRRPSHFRPSLAMNFVTRQLLPTFAFAARQPHAGRQGISRTLFVVPWRNYSLIGTLHAPYEEDERAWDNIIAQTATDFLDEVRAALPGVALQREHIYRVHAGLLPVHTARKKGGVRLIRQSQVYDHHRDDRLDGVITIIGVKYTTARHTAEKAVDLVLQKLGQKQRPCRTATTPLYGGRIACLAALCADARAQWPAAAPTTMQTLVYNYGTEYKRVLDYLGVEQRTNGTIGEQHFEEQLLQAQVRYAIDFEMVQTLSDVVFRRTELGSAGRPSEAHLSLCANIMAAEIGWDRSQREREWRSVCDEPYWTGKIIG